jgi:hypothetical protein
MSKWNWCGTQKCLCRELTDMWKRQAAMILGRHPNPARVRLTYHHHSPPGRKVEPRSIRTSKSVGRTTKPSDVTATSHLQLTVGRANQDLAETVP